MQQPLIEPVMPRLPGSVDIRLCSVQDLLAGMDERSVDFVHADPPWMYRNVQEGSAAGHYDLIDMQDIVQHVDDAWLVAADDSYLALWCTWPMLGDWMRESRIIRWEYLSGGAWVKTGRIGVGYHWRGDSEPLLLYRKGKPKPLATLSNTYSSERTKHSEKPVEWLAKIVSAFCRPGGTVLDLYAGMAPLADACLMSGRRYLGAEIDPERHAQASGLIAGGTRRQPWR